MQHVNDKTNIISADTFNDIYLREIEPVLTQLEMMRIKVRLKFILLWTAFLLAFAGLFYIVKSTSKSDDWLSMVSVLIVISVVAIYYRDKSEEKYKTAYDELVVEKIIKYINPECKSAKRKNEVKEFWGKHSGVEFYCADARTNNIRVTPLGVLGRGFFFRASHGKKLTSKTYIQPDKSEKRYGRSARSVQRRTSGLKNDFKSLGKLIELENPIFEKEFLVYGTKPIEARYILNPVMMESFLKLSNLIKRPLYFVFTKQYIYCHFSYWQFSKPPVYSSILKKNRIKMIMQIIIYCNVIIDELKLGSSK